MSWNRPAALALTLLLTPGCAGMVQAGTGPATPAVPVAAAAAPATPADAEPDRMAGPPSAKTIQATDPPAAFMALLSTRKDDIPRIPVEVFTQMPGATFMALSPAFYVAMSADQRRALTTRQLAGFSQAQFNAIPLDVLKDLNLGQLNEVHIKAFDGPRVAVMDASWVTTGLNKLRLLGTQKQVEAIPARVFGKGMTAAAFGAMSLDQHKWLTDEQLKALNVDAVVALKQGAKSIATLDKVFSDAQLQKLSPMHMVFFDGKELAAMTDARFMQLIPPTIASMNGTQYNLQSKARKQLVDKIRAGLKKAP